MEEEEMREKKAQKKEQGFFGNMSVTQKALLIIFGVAIFFLIWTFVFGGITNFYQLIAFAISFIAIAVLFYFNAFFVSWYLAAEKRMAAQLLCFLKDADSLAVARLRIQQASTG